MTLLVQRVEGREGKHGLTVKSVHLNAHTRRRLRENLENSPIWKPSNALMTNVKMPPIFTSEHKILDSIRATTDKNKKNHHWHLIFNHAHAESIRRTLKCHEHQDGKIQTKQRTCSGFHIGKLKRALHIRVDQNNTDLSVMRR